MRSLKSIAVFCGSSEGNDLKIIDEARALGKQFAQDSITLVYGGAKIGIMGEVASGALEAKGTVIGVIPEFLKQKEVVHHGLSELITVETMHQRKLKIQDLSEGFIALPGGFGTLEELFEIITWGQLGLHQKPIGILNTNGFYNELLQFMEHMVRKGFLKMENYELLVIDASIAGLLQKMKDYTPKRVPKWLKSDRT
ncbi:TIGR00730 family Rossman fold protein [Aquimarina sp. 2-A2]|uniref:LOG family protein n=1 Tax=Aquimarina sp. 2-A2 TaxID=3382644 RepID=UPI00387F2EC1